MYNIYSKVQEALHNFDTKNTYVSRVVIYLCIFILHFKTLYLYKFEHYLLRVVIQYVEKCMLKDAFGHKYRLLLKI